VNLKKAKRIMKLISWYPPYLGAGVKLVEYSPDFSRFVTRMNLRFYNRNMFGTHFGGSLYSMTDPFFVFIVMAYMGEGYTVWDKAACIDFKRPGRGKVRAVMEADKTELADFKAEADAKGKALKEFHAEITDKSGEIVACVSKTIYVRKKANNEN
jgi:acyl-coenzyme A thioesterase PaaI-like protein